MSADLSSVVRTGQHMWPNYRSHGLCNGFEGVLCEKHWPVFSVIKSRLNLFWPHITATKVICNRLLSHCEMSNYLSHYLSILRDSCSPHFSSHKEQLLWIPKYMKLRKKQNKIFAPLKCVMPCCLYSVILAYLIKLVGGRIQF